jgi:hypothetical protein
MQLINTISWPAIVAICIGATAAIGGNMISLIMIGKINSQVPENERISYMWWGGEVRRRYKQLFPNDRLVPLFDACLVLMFLSFIAVVRFWVFG